MKRISAIALLVSAAISLNAQGPRPHITGNIENAQWKVAYDSTGIRGAIDKSDAFGADFIGQMNILGNLNISYKVQDGIWLSVPTDRRTMVREGNSIIYTDATIGDVLSVKQTFTLTDKGLDWSLSIANNSRFPILVGDIAVGIPWNSYVEDEDSDEVFQKTFTKHASISGDGSFFYFTRLGGEAPYPVIIPTDGTPLEYFEQRQRKYFAFIRSGKSGNAEKRGTWRLEHTCDHLAPKGSGGSTLNYGFRLMSAGSYDDIRELLYEYGAMDTRVAPGLTVPRGQRASFALRTRHHIDSVTCEFPSQTRLWKRNDASGAYQIWDVEFDRLGENKVTVWFDSGRKNQLEFFSCLSPETLIKKRSTFLAEHQQWKNTGKWYDGLYGVYDMKNGELRGPDNPDIYDEKTTYFLASDDPVLGKAPFLASKNAIFPNKEEIESLEYHLEHFVWGGLQRTSEEKPLEYGVYGTPNWYINRHQDLRETYSEYKLETTRTWRTYDYPHVFMLWWEMYKIASRYPGLCRYASAEEYLERACQTARVYWLYPTRLLGEYYETFKWGAYNENVLPELIDELERLGRHDDARTLREGWEKKVGYFIHEGYYPYRSEYATDRTAFESSYALADYGIRRMDDKAAAKNFMERQYLANLSCRGVLENQWSVLGSDFLHSSDGHAMTYMSRMGGWGVLGYGLNYASDPFEAIRIGYSSYLATFGLVNAGDKESGYGYWYPGKEKDGALGMAFTNYKYAGTWIGFEEGRGPWRYCGEGDLGLCAVTRTARTILADDPIFGPTLYGGRSLSHSASSISFIPDDGMRERLNIVGRADGGILKGLRLEAILSRDNLSASLPVSLDLKKKTLSLVLENSVESVENVDKAHECQLKLKGGRSVTLDGKRIAGRKGADGYTIFTFPVSKTSHSIVVSL